MKRFESVKKILCISALVSVPLFGEPPLPLACGHYLGKGVIGKNAQGQALLILQKGSSSPLELILLGGDFQQRQELSGLETVVDFYVPRKIASQNEPFVFVKSFTKTDQKFPPEGLIKVRKDACGLKKYAP